MIYLTYRRDNCSGKEKGAQYGPSLHPLLAEAVVHYLLDLVHEGLHVGVANIVLLLKVNSRCEHRFSFFFFIARFQSLKD